MAKLDQKFYAQIHGTSAWQELVKLYKEELELKFQSMLASDTNRFEQLRGECKGILRSIELLAPGKKVRLRIDFED